MRSTLITFLALSLVAGVAALFAPGAEAGPQCIACSQTLANVPPTTTIIVGEDPIDCVWAEMDAMNKANQLCGSSGFCSKTTQFLNNCHANPDPDGIFRAHLQVTYVCQICLDRFSSVDPETNGIDHMLDAEGTECPAPVRAAD